MPTTNGPSLTNGSDSLHADMPSALINGQHSNEKRRKKLVIDTDGCADDVRGLILALQSEEEVLAVTTVAGSTNVLQAVANVARTLRAVGRPDVPIYKGANASLLLSTRRTDALFFFGLDGVGDSPDAEPKALAADVDAAQTDKPGAVALVELAAKYKHELTLVCIGPLTNVALALKLDPNFATNVKEVVIMGGNVWGCGNVPDRSTAEFNFHCDPEAAHIVLDEMKCPMICVPWELFFLEGKKHEQIVDFHAHLMMDTPLAKYLTAVTSVGRTILAADGKQFAYCDEIAVAIALRPEEIITDSKHLKASVELHGQMTRGQVAINWFDDAWPKADPSHRPNVQFVTSYDALLVDKMVHDAVAKLILDTN
uniref:Inosine/uridine-preferring nucleoside hydrolase domain-containing protein n=1 Tax=Plectus sambesii TaxID=2011161 RepID=A0A914VPP9_9BILA